jgi:hypothetical protein
LRIGAALVVTSGLWMVACSSSSPAPSKLGADADAADASPTDDAQAPPWSTYPPPPYGFDVGWTVPPLSFRGHRDGSDVWVDDLSLADYYDPDGTRGVTAILVNEFISGCTWCTPEERDLVLWYSRPPNAYGARGAKFLSGLYDYGQQGPLTDGDLDRFVKAFAIPFDVAFDPPHLLYPRGDAFPYDLLIDPRDMKVLGRFIGSPGANGGPSWWTSATGFPQLDDLIARNGGAPAPGTDAGPD